MDPASQQPKGRDDVLSKLNDAIKDLNRAKEIANITPAKVVFGATSDLLPTIRVSPLKPCLRVDCWLMCTGFDDRRKGLRRVRVVLRRSL